MQASFSSSSLGSSMQAAVLLEVVVVVLDVAAGCCRPHPSPIDCRSSLHSCAQPQPLSSSQQPADSSSSSCCSMSPWFYRWRTTGLQQQQ